MKKLFLSLLILVSSQASANMASPYIDGTLMGSPFVSKYVDIIHEKIEIKPDSSFETASFNIEYQIHVNKTGLQIPLLFYAFDYDYKRGFKVWLDEKEIELQELPLHLEKFDGSSFSDFDYLFDLNNKKKPIELYEHPYQNFTVKIDDLKYFTIDLSEGQHSIRVEFTAQNWVNREDWVKEVSFRYALSPAKYWKSFGSLEISLDASSFGKKLSTNLGSPNTGDLFTKASWTFNELPNEVFYITHKPEINPTAQQLIDFTPANIAYTLGGILVLIHLILVYFYRKSHPQKRYSWVAIVGSLLIPFICLWINMDSYRIIDNYIGHMASRYHGYTFLILLGYPVIMPIYWLVVWLFDKLIKHRHKTG